VAGDYLLHHVSPRLGLRENDFGLLREWAENLKGN
jgi:hypothetical protein